MSIDVMSVCIHSCPIQAKMQHKLSAQDIGDKAIILYKLDFPIIQFSLVCLLSPYYYSILKNCQLAFARAAAAEQLCTTLDLLIHLLYYYTYRLKIKEEHKQVLVIHIAITNKQQHVYRCVIVPFTPLFSTLPSSTIVPHFTLLALIHTQLQTNLVDTTQRKRYYSNIS